MEDSVLKKQFGEKDVQRARNLIQGKVDDRTGEGIGYSKKQEFYEEGDVWEVDGRKWTIKDGIKQNITKLDKAKKAHAMPLLCPNCSKVMKHRNDKTFYKLHKKCFNCVIDMEHELRKEGKWEEYQINIKNNEIDNKIKEFKVWIKERLHEGNDSFVSEDGDIEKWVGKLDESKVEEYTTSVIEYLESLKQ